MFHHPMQQPMQMQVMMPVTAEQQIQRQQHIADSLEDPIRAALINYGINPASIDIKSLKEETVNFRKTIVTVTIKEQKIKK